VNLVIIVPGIILLPRAIKENGSYDSEAIAFESNDGLIHLNGKSESIEDRCPLCLGRRYKPRQGMGKGMLGCLL
jgi:hypothetical protein